MAKLIENNRILLNNNTFSHEETRLLPQFLNDSRTIEQEANLEVQQEQEEHADDEEMLQFIEKFMKDIQTFLEKFSHYPFGVMPKVLSIAWERFFEIKRAFIDEQYQPEEIKELMCKLFEDVRNIREELAEYINSLSWNSPTFYNDDEECFIQYKEYLEKYSNTITTVLPTKEPDVNNLVPIPSEYEVTSDDKSECMVPIKDESSSVFTTFSNPIFDDNDNFTSSVDESLSDEEVPMEEFKEFSGALMPTSIIDEVRIKRQHEEYISLIEKLLSINSFPCPLENFQANMIVETLPTSPILIDDSDTPREEIDIFTGTDDLMPPGIESDDHDSEGDIHFLVELLVNDSISFPDNESSNFDHQDDPSFPRPPPEPPDVEIFFKPDSGVLTTNVVKGISEHYVLMPNIFPTLPTFYPFYPLYDTLLPFSSENKDKVFKPGILSYLLVSHRDKTTSDFFENPMIVYGGDIPLLDV
uniref:Reverse transcriptase domain-containing protein n=1 Tax=Tanacetum cinerariifolium TaxID=118510 RepID=A0A699I9J4_TANCI|nr:hypothetical protein [Tanacetum cinerariifolium]